MVRILHNYMAWSAVLLEEQGKLRGLTWKRTGIGYLKKADFMARVQEHDKGPKRQQQATQQAPLPDADKASEGYDSAASQASRTSQSSKKWHTKAHFTVQISATITQKVDASELQHASTGS
ncbi:hypothetical protein DIPPA_01980 [Diplonema papillatum]|nr:hypothetical protein DIPPA_01980 [Diplonema papillatum]